jgi:hypothetical protein
MIYIIRVIKSVRMRGVGNVVCMRENRNTDRFLVRKPEAKSLLGKYGCRWKDNVKCNLKEIGRKGAGWIDTDKTGTSVGLL